MNNIIEWIKINKNKVIGIVSVMLILAAAFWYGGDSKNSKGLDYLKSKETIKLESSSDKELNESKSDKVTDSKDKNENVSDENKSDITENNSTINMQSSNVSENADESTTSNFENISIGSDSNVEKNSTEKVVNSNTEKTESEHKNQAATSAAATTKPVEVEKKKQCTISISCANILNNMDKLDKDKKSLIPADGWILKTTTVDLEDGESVFDVLRRVCKDNKIHMESSWTPLYNSAYIEGIYNLYEFDCGSLSGWMFSINGEFLNYGSSKSVVKDGDVIKWVYTCDLGNDVK